MRVTNVDRKEAIGATRHVGRLALRLGFSLGALSLVCAFPKSAFAGEPTATVLVYNYARVSRSILARAEREARRVLGAAGVRIIWVECPVESTDRPPVSGDLVCEHWNPQTSCCGYFPRPQNIV